MKSLSGQDIENIFHQCFAKSYHTRLIGGGKEPLYLPSTDPNQPHQIIYREDFPRSALHEIAHWCQAGEKRRQLEDYGY